MKLLGIVVGVLVTTAATLYCGYLWAFPSETIRYRLALEAEVDGKPAVGSGVIEVTRQDTTRIFRTMGGIGAIVKGEAVFLDLGERGSVFALLHGHKADVAEDEAFPAYVLFYAFQNLFDKGKDILEQMRILKKRQPKAELPTRLLPLLVRFRDIDDPKSVQLVDPDNLAAVFGSGVALLRATITITDDPVTTGIEKQLSWLKGLNGRYLDGGFTSRNAPFGLHAGNFQTGVK